MCDFVKLASTFPQLALKDTFFVVKATEEETKRLKTLHSKKEGDVDKHSGKLKWSEEIAKTTIDIDSWKEGVKISIDATWYLIENRKVCFWYYSSASKRVNLKEWFRAIQGTVGYGGEFTHLYTDADGFDWFIEVLEKHINFYGTLEPKQHTYYQ